MVKWALIHCFGYLKEIFSPGGGGQLAPQGSSWIYCWRSSKELDTFCEQSGIQHLDFIIAQVTYDFSDFSGWLWNTCMPWSACNWKLPYVLVSSVIYGTTLLLKLTYSNISKQSPPCSKFSSQCPLATHLISLSVSILVCPLFSKESNQLKTDYLSFTLIRCNSIPYSFYIENILILLF